MNELQYKQYFAVQSLRDAMQDLLTSPKGVIPLSAAPFYDASAGRISTTRIRMFLEKESQ